MRRGGSFARGRAPDEREIEPAPAAATHPRFIAYLHAVRPLCAALVCASIALSNAAVAQEIQLTGPLAAEPSFEPRFRDRTRLDGGGILPFVAVVPSEEPEVFGGGGLRVALSRRLGQAWWFEADLFGAFAGNEAQQLLMMGSNAQVRFHPRVESLGHGLGVSGGYWTASGGTFLESSPFVGPLVSPLSLWLGGTHIEVRVVCLFADTRIGEEHAVRLALIAPQATITFGGSVDDVAKKNGDRPFM